MLSSALQSSNVAETSSPILSNVRVTPSHNVPAAAVRRSLNTASDSGTASATCRQLRLATTQHACDLHLHRYKHVLARRVRLQSASRPAVPWAAERPEGRTVGRTDGASSAEINATIKHTRGADRPFEQLMSGPACPRQYRRATSEAAVDRRGARVGRRSGPPRSCR